MELIRIFMGILLIICLILCIDFKKVNNAIEEHNIDYEKIESISLLGLRVEDFKGRVRVSEVLEHTPAMKSGIEAGDKIIEIDGRKIKNVKNYIDCIENAHDKQMIKLVIHRVDSRSTFPVEVMPLGGLHECKQ